jgi:hypothetical protein
MSQKFKNDAIELKYVNSGLPIFQQLSMALDDFLAGAYNAGPLGDILHNINRSPLANAISLDIFRTSFNTIYNVFRSSGTFESYLTVFRDIFGSDVGVTFTVPAAGKLDIDIVAQNLLEDDFVARHISFETYLFDNVVWWDGTTSDGGNILFQSVKGFKTQYELEQMLFEMVPIGIFTTITLTFGV